MYMIYVKETQTILVHTEQTFSLKILARREFLISFWLVE